MLIRVFVLVSLLTVLLPGLTWAQNSLTYVGQWSINRYAPNSVAAPFGAYGTPYAAAGLNNPYSRYGSVYGAFSATNPYATKAPMLFDGRGNYRGNLSTNRYDPFSISNPYGAYGSPFSPDSVNNPYGAGSRYLPDSPLNPYGSGWTVLGW